VKPNTVEAQQVNKMVVDAVRLWLPLLATVFASAKNPKEWVQHQPYQGSCENLERPSHYLSSSSVTNNHSHHMASLFEHPRCRTAIEETGLENWIRTARPPPKEPSRRFIAGLANGQQLLRSQPGDKSKPVLYVRNQKVASVLIYDAFSCFFGLKKEPLALVIPYLEPFANASSRLDQLTPPEAGGGTPMSASEPEDSFFTFSFVGDPLKVAFAAYLEVNRRAQRGLEFAGITCTNSEDATRRYIAFLDAALQGEQLGDQSFHIYPQALKINALLPRARGHRRFDFLGRLEFFEEDMFKAQDAASGTAGAKSSPFPGKAFRTSAHHTTSTDPCHNANLNDPRVAERFCRLYAVDYLCFGYPVPQMCSGVLTSSRPVSNKDPRIAP